MVSFKYYLSKILKKIRGSAIKNSKISATARIQSGCNILNIIMGNHSYCGYDCEIIYCEIGSFCSIANNVVIGGPGHPMSWVSMSPLFSEDSSSIKTKFSKHKFAAFKKTIIEHDVWIGQYAIIKQGIHIGTGAVIGMGSVVTKDVEPYSIVAGNPAREIRKRFDERTISKLLESKWWEFNDSELKKYSAYFTDPEEFIKVLGI